MSNKNTQVIEVITKGAKKSEKEVKGVSSGLKSMAKSAALAAGAYFGSRALLDGIQQSVKLFAQQELAEKKLRFAAGASTNQLIKQAQALQSVTRFGDEAIIAQQAYVKSLGISTEQTQEIIAASVDLAAAMGISLESAVMNTTKTLSGMQGELGEKLPAAFKELTAEQLKAGEGIKFIREQFKGTAEEETDTLTGALDQLSNAFGDMRETMGARLAPTIKALANSFTDFISIPVSETMKKEQIEVNVLTSRIINNNDNRQKQIKLLKQLKDTYPEYFGQINTELNDINELTDALDDYNKMTAEKILIQRKTEEIADINEKQADSISNVNDQEVKLATTIAGLVGQTIEGHTLVVDTTQSLVDQSKDLQSQMQDLSDDDFFQGAINSTINSTMNLRDATSDYTDAVDFNKQKQTEYGDEINRVQGEIEDLNQKIIEGQNLQTDVDVEANGTATGTFDFDFDEDTQSSFDAYSEAMFNKMVVDETARQNEEENIRLRKEFIATYPEEAAQLNMLTSEQMKFNKLKKQLSEESKVFKIKETLMNTFEGANALYKGYVSTYPPPIGQILGAAAYVATIAKGKKDVQQIQKAQYGADFVTLLKIH
mgnify:FL=1